MEKITIIHSQKKAYFYALLAVLFWSTISSAFKITLRYMQFDELLLWATMSGVILLSVIKFFGKHKFSSNDFKLNAMKSSALMGLFNPFIYYLVLIKAYSLLETQEAVTLNYVWPIFLVFFSMIFLKQKVKFVAIIALLISFAGIVIVIFRGNFSKIHFTHSWGVALALSSALFWASYWILNMKDHRDDITKIWMNLTFGLFYIILYYCIIHKSLTLPCLKGLLGAIYIGFFEMSITFVIWLKALNYSQDTAKVSNIIYLAPFIALFWISKTVGETIRVSTIIGLFFIVTGIVLQQYYAWKR